jgi:hypothetical protein
MAGTEAGQSRAPLHKPGAAQFAVLSVCGALAGAVAGFLGALAEGAMAGEHDLFWAEWLFEYPLNGLGWGLIGGLLTAIISLYWRGAAGLKQATLFWGSVLAIFGLLTGALVGEDAGLAKALRLGLGGAAIGAAFGAVLAVSARAVFRIGGPKMATGSYKP